MEKEAFFGDSTVKNWQMRSPDGAASHPRLNSGHLNFIWDQTIDQSANFGSALSSLVSSPSSNPPATTAGGDSVVIRELIGRLGSICNSDEISAPSSRYQSTNNSCYSTPMNSPPKLNHSTVPNPAHMPFSADLGFVERAAKCSTFGCSSGGSHGGGQFMFPEVGKLENAREESSGSGNTKKRKATMKGKGKEAPLSSSITAVTHPPKKAGVRGLNAKRSKSSEDTGIEESARQDGDAASKKMEEENITKPQEVAKDYIHVRARRGQATDSHSLAERVRREKISERMKLLQDLVPGCSKVTGKAVMLDEIINYVQLLQRQVEFLSMKLSTVNPQLEFNLDNFATNDMEIHQNCGLLPPQPLYPLEATSNSFSFANLPERTLLISINGLEVERQVNPFNHNPNSRNNVSMQQPPIESFVDTSCQLGAFWDDDLRTVVQMGFSQNQENVFSSQIFQG